MSSVPVMTADARSARQVAVTGAVVENSERPAVTRGSKRIADHATSIATTAVTVTSIVTTVSTEKPRAEENVVTSVLRVATISGRAIRTIAVRVVMIDVDTRPEKIPEMDAVIADNAMRIPPAVIRRGVVALIKEALDISNHAIPAPGLGPTQVEEATKQVETAAGISVTIAMSVQAETAARTSVTTALDVTTAMSVQAATGGRISVTTAPSVLVAMTGVTTVTGKNAEAANAMALVRHE